MTIRIFYARRIFYEVQKICKNAIFGVFFAIRYDFADILQNTYPKHIKIFWGKVYDVLRPKNFFGGHPQNILHRSIVPQAILLLEKYCIWAIFVGFSAYVLVCRQYKESSKMCLACQKLFRKQPKQSLTTPVTPDNLYGCLQAIQSNHQNDDVLVMCTQKFRLYCLKII